MSSVRRRIIVLAVVVMFVLFGRVLGFSAQENDDPKKIDMIQFVEKMEKVDLEELVLLLVSDSLNTSVYEMLESPEDGMTVIVRMKIKSADDLAKSTLRTISVAAETFTTAPENEGKYPLKIEDLTEDKEPYLSQAYCEETMYGFKYGCDFSAEGYRFVATPEVTGETGSGVFVITTGGVFEEKEAEKN